MNAELITPPEKIATPRQPLSISVQLAWVVAACTLVTLLAWPLQNALDPANIAMLYLLAVALIAWRADRFAAILSAIVCTGLLDFFFIRPQFTLSVADAQHVVTLAVMLVVALIIANLTISLQNQVAEAIERERRSQALYQLASRLAGTTSLEQVDALTSSFLQETQACHGALLMRHGKEVQPVAKDLQPLSGKPYYAAQRALSQGTVLATLDEPEQWLFLPLHGSTYIRGVLALSAPDIWLLRKERRPLFEAIASLVAISVERLHFVEVAHRTQLQITDERLRSSILAALSHDIRTPLTVLYGMTDTLALTSLPPTASATVAALREQTLKLNNMVSNLLDMAKLRAGNIRLNPEWQPVEEVIGASIKLLGTALAQHPVKVILQPDMPLLKFDAVLMERVLCNLLENATKYAPPASTITLSAKVDGDQASLSVCDTGPGFPPDKLDKVFDLFERGEAESTVPGVGLGLAICRSIVAAHGGTIFASNEHGGCVTFTLPLGDPPVFETDDSDEPK
jgi:two-component system sensor histidine kinase KdpD